MTEETDVLKSKLQSMKSSNQVLGRFSCHLISCISMTNNDNNGGGCGAINCNRMVARITDHTERRGG